MRLLTDILDHTARTFDVDPDELIGHGRRQYIVLPRFAFVWVCRRMYGPDVASYPMLARYMSRSDHTAVRYAFERAEEIRTRSPMFREVTDRLLDECRRRPADVIKLRVVG